MPEPPAAAFDLNGVNKGIMPADFGSKLSKTDLAALVGYLSTVTK